VSGLKNGINYWFAIQATDVDGQQSGFSLPIDGVIPREGWPDCGLEGDQEKSRTLPAPKSPTVPLNVHVRPGKNKLCVMWLEPESDGGSPIIDYQVEALPARQRVLTSKTGTLHPISTIKTFKVVEGLDSDWEYDVTVRAGTKPPNLAFLTSPKTTAVRMAPEEFGCLTFDESGKCDCLKSDDRPPSAATPAPTPSPTPSPITDVAPGCTEQNFPCSNGHSLWTCIQDFILNFCAA